ncbi:MAG: hypothetical protein KF748_02550 [Xanthobacteraceae bacterium]|nr:hypothetical protein [Xanthobacteraceae bacterium]
MFRVFVVSTAVFSALGANMASAAECRPGDRVSLSVLVQGEFADTGDGWFYEGVSARPCSVSKIVGKGRPPANCKDGQVLIATGTVEDLLGPTLMVASAICK